MGGDRAVGVRFIEMVTNLASLFLLTEFLVSSCLGGQSGETELTTKSP